MIKKILLFALMIFTITTTVIHADDNDLKTPASKAYVDIEVAKKQNKIPAANQPGVGEGETVMTYTAAGNGQIGERGIYDDASSYDASTDADKLITASALKDRFANLPTTGTTKLQCANSPTCSLWTVVDQTAYGNFNLYNPIANPIEQGSIASADGQGFASPRRVRTAGYIDVAPNTQYTISEGGLTYFFVNPYNSNGEYLKGTGITGWRTSPYTFRTSANTGKIRIVFANGQSDNSSSPNVTPADLQWLQIELGTTATPH